MIFVIVLCHKLLTFLKQWSNFSYPTWIFKFNLFIQVNIILKKTIELRNHQALHQQLQRGDPNFLLLEMTHICTKWREANWDLRSVIVSCGLWPFLIPVSSSNIKCALNSLKKSKRQFSNNPLQLIPPVLKRQHRTRQTGFLQFCDSRRRNNRKPSWI